MIVLVMNAGSSSLKYQLIDTESEEWLARGVVERIGTPSTVLKHEPRNGGKIVMEEHAPTHLKAVRMVLDALCDKTHGVISGLHEIEAAGHRIVNGGYRFIQSTIVDDSVVEGLKEAEPLAPLHIPGHVMGIEALRTLCPDMPMVCVFDTAFHQTMPPKAYLYGLPYYMYEDWHVRKYGFHGTSHKFICQRVGQLLDKDPKELKMITCHLGNGASLAAIDHGEVVDTSMGFTPLEGLMMGTRTGDIDPAVIPFVMKRTGILDIDDFLMFMNKECGVYGLSKGISSDFRDLWSAADKGDYYAKTALEAFCYRVKKYIGAYMVAMGGVDVIVYTAGIGENDYRIREMCVEGMENFGIIVDKTKNYKISGKEVDITADGSKVKIFAIPTNEELMIAREVVDMVGKSS